jgi:hypothetical protein
MLKMDCAPGPIQLRGSRSWREKEREREKEERDRERERERERDFHNMIITVVAACHGLAVLVCLAQLLPEWVRVPLGERERETKRGKSRVD